MTDEPLDTDSQKSPQRARDRAGERVGVSEPSHAHAKPPHKRLETSTRPHSHTESPLHRNGLCGPLAHLPLILPGA